jgi:hypothetical protein
MIFIDTALQGHHDFMKYAFREPENFFKSITNKMKILLPENNFMLAKVEFAMRIETLVVLFCPRQSLLHGAPIHD